MHTALFGAMFGGEDLGTDVEPIVVTPEVAVIQEQDARIAELEKETAEQETVLVELQNAVAVVEEGLEEAREDIAGVEAMIRGDIAWNPELAKHRFNSARNALNKLSFGAEPIKEVEGNESFATPEKAEMELHKGMEAMGTTLKKGWEGVKRFFINIYNTAIAIIVSIFSTVEGLSKKAAALKTRLANTPDDKMKKEIKVGKWNFYVGVTKQDGAQSKTIANAVKNMYGTLSSVQSALAKNDVDGALNAVGKLSSTVENKKSGANDENNEVVMGDVGNIVFTFVLPKASAKDKVAALKKVSVSYKPDPKAKAEGTATGLSKSALGTILSECADDISILRNGKFDRKALENARDKAVSEASHLEASGSDEKEARKKSVASIKAAHNAGLNVLKTGFKYACSLTGARLAHVNAHF